MSDSIRASLSVFFGGVELPTRSLVVVNRQEPDAVQNPGNAVRYPQGYPMPLSTQGPTPTTGVRGA